MPNELKPFESMKNISISLTGKRKGFKMTKAKLKIEIEKFAKENNVNFLTACSHMQGACAQMGDESLITEIHKLKLESLKSSGV